MSEDQANDVLRKTAEHALTMIQFLYGEHHAKAAELIKEALTVSRAAQDAKRKE